MTKDKIYRVRSLRITVALLLLFVIPSLTYAANSNNVSILYGWNGTNYVPVQITSDGAIKMDINLTQTVGINPKVNNTYDLGSLSRLWANLYVRSVRGGSGPLSFFANGNEVITLLASGNVGIGTTTPQTRLDVEGGGNFTGDVLVSNVSILTRQSSDNATLAGSIGTKVNLTQLGSYELGTAHTSDNTTLAALLGQKLNLTGGNVSGAINLATTSGNVGIGTTTPGQQLTVIGTANITGGVIAPNVTFGDGTIQVSASTGTNISMLYGMNESSTSQPIAVKVDSSGALKMAISGGTGIGWGRSGSNIFLTSSGDSVGIGTTTPASKLHVAGDMNVTGVVYANVLNVSGTNSTFSGDVRIFGTLYGGSPVKVAGLNVTDGNLFVTGALVVNNTLITSSGSTSLPAANITAGTFGSGLFTFPSGLNITQGGLLVNGNVGIGTVVPGATLEVNGTIKMTPRESATCDAAGEGSLFYNITDKHFYGCNSTEWLRIDTTYS